MGCARKEVSVKASTLGLLLGRLWNPPMQQLGLRTAPARWSCLVKSASKPLCRSSASRH